MKRELDLMAFFIGMPFIWSEHTGYRYHTLRDDGFYRSLWKLIDG